MTKKILLVDDEIDVLATLKEELELLGHEVVTTEDPSSVTMLLAQHIFDVIVLDIMMPKLNGLDLVKVMRPKTDAKIVVLSAISEVMKTDPTMNLVNMVVEKPYGAGDLKKIVA